MKNENKEFDIWEQTVFWNNRKDTQVWPTFGYGCISYQSFGEKVKRTALNEEEGTVVISKENREEFNTEYNELINIEHDLEIEKLNFPKKIEDGFSATDLNILETFFDLSGLEETLTEQE